MKAHHFFPKLIDTHCHVQFNAFHGETDIVIKRTLSEKIWMIVVGTNYITSQQAVSIAERYPSGIYASVGIHPSHTHGITEDLDESITPQHEELFDIQKYEDLARSVKVVAIGETGLDFYRLPEESKEHHIRNQKKSFRQHLHLAYKLNLPLIIHCREAHEEMIQLLHTEVHEQKELRGVIHCFSGTIDQALRYIDLGFYISITGNVTYPSRKEGKENPLYEIVRRIELDRIMIETDAPYLAPIPHRGKRNEPAFVLHIVQKLSEITGYSIDEISRRTTENAMDLFGLRPAHEVETKKGPTERLARLVRQKKKGKIIQ